MNILLLTESTDSYATMSLVRAFESRKHIVTIVRPTDLSLLVSDNPSGYDRAYKGQKGTISRIEANHYDVVYPRIGGNLRYGVAILDHLKNNVGIYCVPSQPSACSVPVTNSLLPRESVRLAFVPLEH